ncbi:hypothetical protein, partial [Pseudomonas aeruginosa]|uniref:hypothetical protein n=1 Tax=Pseudomonas aeruginosa TaxID=287 RepID=UPI0019D0F962
CTFFSYFFFFYFLLYRGVVFCFLLGAGGVRGAPPAHNEPRTKSLCFARRTAVVARKRRGM